MVALDPGAAGVLPLLLGKATKFSSYLMDLPKVYRAELFLGLTTDTEDSSGKVIAQKKEPFSLQAEEIKKVLTSFQGEIEQVPPMYAAIKQKGRKLYEYARKGITVQRSARTVQIYSIKMLDYFPGKGSFGSKMFQGDVYPYSLCTNRYRPGMWRTHVFSLKESGGGVRSFTGAHFG